MISYVKSKYFIYGLLKRAANKPSLKDPFFIIGTGRSGTTLLVKVLKTNKDINISESERTSLFHYKSKNRWLLNPPDTDLVDIERFSRNSSKKWFGFRKFVIKTFLLGMANLDDRIFIQKNPAIQLLVPDLLQLFPRAKVIHIYRDPLYIVNSLLIKQYLNPNPKMVQYGKYKELYSKSEFTALCLDYVVKTYAELNKLESSSDFNKKIMSFSYENLVLKYDEVTKSLADFLGVKNQFDFNPDTLEMRNKKNFQIDDSDLALFKKHNELFRKYGYEY